MASSSIKNSTNVRINEDEPKGSGWARAVVGAARAVSIGLAGTIASRLFFLAPPRLRVSRSETAVMTRGVPGSIWTAAARVATWTWRTRAPNPRTALLVHGWGGRGAQLASFVDPLLAAGFDVIAFDAPAHGDSSGRTASVDSFARAIEGIALAAPRGIDLLVAHSFGGLATSLALSRGVRVRRAAYVGAPADPSDWFDRFSRILRLDPELRALAREKIEASVGIPIRELAAESLVPKLEVPLLLVHDKSDREVPHADGERILRNAKSAKLVSTDGLGHRRILRDAGAIEEIRRFAGGVKHTCESCGAETSGERQCSRCRLSIELFDRDARWAA